MKKLAIAGASFALAAMPVAGVFAVDFTDTLQATVSDSCSFTRQSTAHSGGTWTTDTNDATKDILTAVSITPGAEESTLGSSAFNVKCNNYAGYQVTFTTDALTLTEGTALNTWAYTGTGAAAQSGSYWYLTSSANSADYANSTAIKAEGTTSSAATPAAGVDFTITYKAKAAADQDTGTYATNVAYTFAQL